MKQHLTLSMVGLTALAFVAGCCCQPPSPPSNGVQIKVMVGNLSDEEVEELKGKLADIAGNTSSVSTVINGAATWNYSTDVEPQEFADQIDFATVKSVEDRVITLQLNATETEEADDPAGEGDSPEPPSDITISDPAGEE